MFNGVHPITNTVNVTGYSTGEKVPCTYVCNKLITHNITHNMLTDSKNTDFKRFRANYAVSVQSVANDLFVRISVEFRQFLGIFPQAVSFVQKHYLHTKLPNS